MAVVMTIMAVVVVVMVVVALLLGVVAVDVGVPGGVLLGLPLPHDGCLQRKKSMKYLELLHGKICFSQRIVFIKEIIS